MPGFDGRGPFGAGPMTGGGRGWCAVGYAPGYGPGYGTIPQAGPRQAVQHPWMTFVPEDAPWGMANPYTPRGVGRGGLPWGGGKGRCWGGGRGRRGGFGGFGRGGRGYPMPWW